MGSYATIESMIETFGKEDLVEITDIEKPFTGEINVVKLQELSMLLMAKSMLIYQPNSVYPLWLTHRSFKRLHMILHDTELCWEMRERASVTKNVMTMLLKTSRRLTKAKKVRVLAQLKPMQRPALTCRR